MRCPNHDVFTDRPPAGSPLAVLLDADALGAERMQAIAGDPATGNARGPLGGYRAAHGGLPKPPGDAAAGPGEGAFVSHRFVFHPFVFHQGIEMGRPSELRMRMDAEDVGVDGGAVPVAVGEREL